MIRYEINPPRVIQEKVLSHKEVQSSLDKLKKRIFEISKYCNGIHLTDSVLGVPRISPITTGALIRNDGLKINITASLRVRDRNLISLTQSVYDAVLLGLDGLLILKGDEPPEGPKDSKLAPSEVVKYFKDLGFGENLDFYLSIPASPNFDKIQKKIDVAPTGFVTQVIQAPEQVFRIVDRLKPQGFRIIPVIMVPSEKNAKSFAMLGVDQAKFKDRFVDFVTEIHKSTGDVLITSPNDFRAASEVLEQLKELKRN
ncbi:methylenetetrahydrofolate reductase [Candidatus Nitrosotenuis chungbukensis]|uniref:methylenetetrahydrofolate reductase n=1 Tax=Candidatus Nitrosotenuis chungbukensis TaxID=1353246 RepID=UPI000694628E|nr:methylenetetrahydrofolate reductase [Candidatus Nitrosotenuis chungbukensis]